MRFKRLFLCFTLVFTLALGLTPSVAKASTNDFTFDSFKADYYLSKDSSDHSTMKVVENLVAVFPNYDQNKGIVRDIPRIYDGHMVNFQLVSLTRNGASEHIYSQEENDDFIEISTGTEQYLTGTQRYTLTYTLKDVTKSFDDHQELYWDTNGTGWQQTFNSVTAVVHLDNKVTKSFSGATSCYEGVAGSHTRCNITKIDDNTYQFTSTRAMKAYENVTLVMGFEPKTFSSNTGNMLAILILGAIAIMALVVMILVRCKFCRDARKGIIIPQYTAPEGIGLLEVSQIYDGARTWLAAQIIDLAVRGNIRIIETEKSTLSIKHKNQSYILQLAKLDGLSDIELSFIDSLFGGRVIGCMIDLDDSDSSRSVRLNRLDYSVRNDMQTKGYTVRKPVAVKVSMISLLVLIASIIGILIAIAESNGTKTMVIWLFAGMIILFIVISLRDANVGKGGRKLRLINSRPLSEIGRKLLDYVLGLKMYIKLAEADRLRYLQSPQGAEKQPIDINNTAEIVKLYEKLLPYAVLFRQEKEWAKQLGTYYEQIGGGPVWYSGGSEMFNASSFVSSVSSFTSSATNSSSSGLGGSGSSGGGGGGGGGGGR